MLILSQSPQRGISFTPVGMCHIAKRSRLQGFVYPEEKKINSQGLKGLSSEVFKYVCILVLKIN
jgi:hypothetical protein